MIDFDLYGGPSVFVLYPHTEEAQEWIDNNLPADAPTLGNGVAIEHRYVGDIYEGILRDGLTIKRSH